jgi:prepilin-type N-terminal cleavage/methylation domain-containing protein
VILKFGMKPQGHRCRSKFAGYSLVEMMMTLAIGLILASIALPTVIGAIQSYRLNGVAQQVANLVELTRYTAIRRNSVMTLQMKVVKGSTVFFIDLNGNGQADPNDPMVVLPNDMQVPNGNAPDSSSTGLAVTQNFAGQITFDYRGTVTFPVGPLTPYFLTLGYVTQAQYGSRAITVMPMGQTKIWKAPDGATWTAM